MRFQSLSLIRLMGIVVLPLLLDAHEGHSESDHSHSGTIEGGKLVGADGVTYLDAGQKLKVGTLELSQKIGSENQILYSTNFENAHLNQNVKENSFLSLDLEGGEILSAMHAKTAVHIPPIPILQSPQFAGPIQIDQKSGLALKWVRVKGEDAYSIQIVIESLGANDEAKAISRLTAETADDGFYIISSEALKNLPSGPVHIAVKRVQIGGFEKSDKSVIAVKSVATQIGKGFLKN